ncbi:Phosphodiesterase [Aphelenchoides fujianensis]|nr:Phosphodiesterase [Aphelenchoides fujianensis]
MSVQIQPELNADQVLDYLTTHPAFLESFVTGSHISRETFQRWTLKRNNRLRKDSRRQLLSVYTSPAGRAQSRRALLESAHNPNRLLYELALTCTQIAQVDNFELLVRTDGGAIDGDSTVDPEHAGPSWMNVVATEDGRSIRLRKPKRNRKPALHIQKLIDCNEVLLAEIHFYSVVNDRDAQYLNVLCTWGCSMIYFAGLATRKDPPTAMSPSLAEDHEFAVRQRQLNGFLLDVLRSIFQDMNTMDVVILKIMNYAQKLVNADRSSLFLVDQKAGELHAQMFDVGQEIMPSKNAHTEGENEQQSNRKEIKFPVGKGIAGHVALTGKGLNISDAYEDERFNREVDLQTGYRTKTILCMPIFMRGNIIGVVQMVNKLAGTFTKADEESFETFAIYCGLALHHAKLYDKIRRSEQKYRVALEVLAYHANAIPELDYFEFNGNRISELEKPLYAVYMFRTLFGDFLRFEYDDLIRFTLTVRKNYRKVPYHNWTHGWTVAHAMFVFLRQTKVFKPLEALALFVAAICHDLDHRGKNNAYMKSMSTPLASIYSTSVMEHHHFNQTVTILQQDGHNILRSLRGEEYRQVLSIIKHCILATDLALFFPNRANLQGIVERKEFSWSNDQHRSLCQAIIMTSCDLISTAKPWEVQTETVKVIFDEFYEQGDAEKLNGKEPIPMMDRSKASELPQMQVGFMKGICVPCYDVISKVIPEAEPLKERSLYNLRKWQEMADEQEAHKKEQAGTSKS